MDILNFISWIKGSRVVTTVDPAKTLLPVGLKDNRRDDGYLAGAISVENLVTQLTPEPAYKVFTALLTQSGGDNQLYVENFSTIFSIQNIVKGVSYFIDVNDDNVDFSLIGASSNAQGTSFIATENKLNTDFPDVTWALRYNTGAPVVTVLENTIGNIWFTYLNIGTYIISSNSLFTINKTATFTTTSSKPNDPYWITMQAISQQEIYLVQFDVDGSTYNDLLSTPIEIRVYN
jgi:hypothetical protein